VRRIELEQHEKPDVNPTETLEELTPLIFTRIQHGDMRSVERFLLLEGDLNHSDKEKNTLLNIACRYGQKDIASFLMHRKEIDINTQSMDGSTPLIRASYYGYAFITDLLLQNRDIDVNMRDNEGNTALHVAIAYNRNLIVEKLLEHPSINLSLRKNSNTYAIHACIHHNFDALKRLLPRDDVEIHSANRNGKTALKLLHEHRAMKELAGEDITLYKEMEELLIRREETVPSPETPAYKKKILEKLAKKNERLVTVSEQRKHAMEEKRKISAEKHKPKNKESTEKHAQDNKKSDAEKASQEKEGAENAAQPAEHKGSSLETGSKVVEQHHMKFHIETGKENDGTASATPEQHTIERHGSDEHFEELKKVLNKRVGESREEGDVEIVAMKRIIKRTGQKEDEETKPAPIVTTVSSSQENEKQEHSAVVKVHEVDQLSGHQETTHRHVVHAREARVRGEHALAEHSGERIVIHAEPIKVTRVAYGGNMQAARDNASDLESVFSHNQIAEVRHKDTSKSHPRIIAVRDEQPKQETRESEATSVEKDAEELTISEHVKTITTKSEVKEETRDEDSVMLVEEEFAPSEIHGQHTIVLRQQAEGAAPAQPTHTTLVPLSKYHVYKKMRAREHPKKMRVISKHNRREIREEGVKHQEQDV